MADEIVAKYRVDVSGASASLDQLAAKTQKTGKTLDDSFNKGSDGVKRLQAELAKQPKTLADLELRLVKLKELLRDDTKIGTEGFKQVTKAINDTNAAIKQANASLAESPKQTNFVTDGFKKLGAAMVAAFAVDKIVSFVKESVELAAKAEGVERAFRRVGSAQLLDGLRSATRNTVNDLTLMTTAVQASNFKIPLENLAKYMEFANARAKETGKSVDYLIESILTGVGRGSIEVWDNMGISLSDVRSRLNGVSIESLTVADRSKLMSDIVTEELSKMGQQADTTSDKIAQIETAFYNLRIEAGKAFIEIANRLLPDDRAFDTQVKGTMEYANAIRNAGNIIRKDYEMTLRVVEGRADREKVLAEEAAVRETKLTELKSKLASMTSAQVIKDDQMREFLLRKAVENAVGFNIINRYAAKERLSEFLQEKKERIEQVGILREQIVVYEGLGKVAIKTGKDTMNPVRSIEMLENQLKDLQDEFKKAEIGTKRYIELKGIIVAKQAEIKKALGEETEAMKNQREEREKLNKIEEKRAEEYNKAQEAEAERLLKQEEDNAKERVKIAEDMAKMLIDIEKYLATTSEEIRDVELADNQRQYEKDLEDVINAGAAHVLQGEELSTQLQAITDAKNKANEESEAAHQKRILDLTKANIEKRRGLELNGIKLTEDEKQQVVQASGQAIAQLTGMISQRVIEGYQMELTALEERYNQGLISEQQYQRERASLLAKQFRAQQDAAIIQAVINTALAVTSALTAGPIIGPILAAISAALGAAEIAVILSQPTPQFANGVVDLQGEGTGTSDSISAKLSKGESVITAKETSKHKGLLEAMNKGLAEKYILSNYVKPALDSAMLSGFADMGKSAEFNGLTANLKDHNIIAAMDRNRQATVQGLKIIAERMSNQKAAKRGGYA